ncbi:MAG: hypothetical protein U5K38_05570 [Woeseiaceae bacterium]|nr:hypothetical protein [Woeseiaceae bacterium]
MIVIEQFALLNLLVSSAVALMHVTPDKQNQNTIVDHPAHLFAPLELHFLMLEQILSIAKPAGSATLSRTHC